jgi:hypothetical protein
LAQWLAQLGKWLAKMGEWLAELGKRLAEVGKLVTNLLKVLSNGCFASFFLFQNRSTDHPGAEAGIIHTAWTR